MRRAAWAFAIVLLLPVLAAGLLLAGLNTAPGQRAAARAVAALTGGQVALTGLSGSFPDALHADSLVLRDGGGAWLRIDDLVLDWSPLRLLHGEARIDRLSAGLVALARLPRAGPAPAPASAAATPFRLPVAVNVAVLAVARLELGAAVAGHAAVLSVHGTARLPSLEQGAATLDLARLDAPGRYRLDGSADAGGLRLAVVASEPAQGLASALAGLPDLVPAGDTLALGATLDGPWTGAALKASLSAGALHASASGRLDLRGEAADLDIAATAPAMAPRPDLSWGSVSLTGRLRGTLAAPTATATLQVAKLAAFGAALDTLTADAGAKDGRVVLDAGMAGLHAPGVGGLFAAAPLRLHAETGMDAAAIAVTLDHALLHAHGTLRPGGQSDLAVALPELAPFAALGGVDARGTAALDAKVTLAPFLTVDAGGTVALTGGQAPLPGLIGADGRFALRASRQGGDIAVSALTLDGARLHATAQGGMTGGVLGVDWTLGLPDLAVLAPSLDGALALRGRVAGAPGAMTVNATLTGDLAPAGRPRGPVTASIEASGLPDAPTGRIVAGGTLDGAPLDVLATAARDAAGVLHLDIARAGWKSAHAEGALTLAPGATLPQGRIALGMTALSDLQALLGRKLAGGLSAEAVLEPGAVRLQLDATKLDLAGSAAGTLGLTATLRDPLGARVTTATLAVDGFRAGGVAGRLRLEAEGPPSALGLRLNADVADLGGAALRAAAAGTLDAEAGRLNLSALTADWRDQHLALARRLRVDFASGVSLDGLELRLGAATLSAKGRVLPALDLTASLRDLPAGLARLAAPGLKLAGTVSADARLTGPPARPAGTIRLHGAGLRVTEGAGATLKPADLAATATLAGERATLDARLRVGSDSLSLAGSLPLGAGAMDLRARGQVDLAALNALVAAEGRQVQGRLALDAGITGTAAAPQVGGTLHLTGGVVQDIPLGLRVRDIAATVTASGQTIRLASLTGRAGDGSIGASGTLSLASPMTLSLALTAKDAQLLASELVHGTLDADLTVQGALPDGLAARGTVTLGRTEIRVPDSLPAGVAVLDVRRPGQAPPPPASPGPVVGLDVAIRAPGQILVRGRGLDAELQGNLRVLGSSADPRPQGRFTLRRGSYTLAGKTLSFTSGTLQFDGGLPVDPTLDFVASSTSGDITATLTVTGHASAPKIVLSSAPELPQDEVLAQLLFNKSTVNLGPVELAQIAAALAQMAGGTSFDPLEAVRAGLGLDRLSVSGGSGSGQSSGATVEAGRSLAPGVYLGAKQNATGTGTKGTVEIDLGRGVRLQAGVGSSGTSSATGAAGNMGTDVGVTWQFDY